MRSNTLQIFEKLLFIHHLNIPSHSIEIIPDKIDIYCIKKLHSYFIIVVWGFVWGGGDIIVKK